MRSAKPRCKGQTLMDLAASQGGESLRFCVYDISRPNGVTPTVSNSLLLEFPARTEARSPMKGGNLICCWRQCHYYHDLRHYHYHYHSSNNNNNYNYNYYYYYYYYYSCMLLLLLLLLRHPLPIFATTRVLSMLLLVPRLLLVLRLSSHVTADTC